jgi:hypothetical protein
LAAEHPDSDRAAPVFDIGERIGGAATMREKGTPKAQRVPSRFAGLVWPRTLRGRPDQSRERRPLVLELARSLAGPRKISQHAAAMAVAERHFRLPREQRLSSASTPVALARVLKRDYAASKGFLAMLLRQEEQINAVLRANRILDEMYRANERIERMVREQREIQRSYGILR